MLELFIVGLKEDGTLAVEINEELLQVANEEDLLDVFEERDMKILHHIAMKISNCIEGE